MYFFIITSNFIVFFKAFATHSIIGCIILISSCNYIFKCNRKMLNFINFLIVMSNCYCEKFIDLLLGNCLVVCSFKME
jgi:hypothetical protein